MPARNHDNDSLIATLLSWFQFSLFGFSAHMLGSNIFPALQADQGLLMVYSIFAAGGLARFAGAMALSPLGDRLGASRLLRSSLVLMAMATLLIGIVPGAARIGASAALILLVLRLLQGAALGGEYTASLSLAVDAAKPQRRSWSSSLSAVGGQIGFLLGALSTALVIQQLGHAAAHSWGWRLPFLAAGLVGLVYGLGFGEKHGVSAIPAPQHQAPSLLATLHRHGPRLVAIAAVVTFPLVVFNVVFIYFVNLQTMSTGVLTAQATLFTTVVQVFAVPLLLMGGWLGDRLGDQRLTQWGSVALAAVTLPATALASMSPLGLFLAQLMTVVPLCVLFSLEGSVLSRWLPQRDRSTVLAVGYNLANLMASLSLLVSTILLQQLKWSSGPSLYCLIWALPCLVALRWLSREANRDNRTALPPQGI